ncbi:MAG: hypothetical protein Q8O93_05330 [bacterium]|nr:hypothetical protein [bacterium]
MKKYRIPLLITVIYIVIVLSLGFGIKDDYFMWTFPSWPILVGCTEDCSELRMVMATVINGALLGLAYIFVKYLFTNTNKK